MGKISFAFIFFIRRLRVRSYSIKKVIGHRVASLYDLAYPFVCLAATGAISLLSILIMKCGPEKEKEI